MPGKVMYSLDAKGRKVDADLWEELLGDDDVPDDYAVNLTTEDDDEDEGAADDT